MWLPEKGFPVLTAVTETPATPRQSLSKPVQEPQVEEPQPVIPQSLLRLRQLTKEDMDAIPDSDVFSNDFYFFNGFNDEVRAENVLLYVHNTYRMFTYWFSCWLLVAV